jgi:hypothetical protein
MHVWMLVSLSINARLDQRFARLKSRVNLHSWMLGASMAATVIPALYSLFNSARG